MAEAPRGRGVLRLWPAMATSRALGRLRAAAAAHPGTLLSAGAVCLALAGCSMTWALLPAWRLLDRFAAAGTVAPSRLYTRPPVVTVGEALASADLGELLAAAGYSEGVEPPGPGRWTRSGRTLTVHLRRFATESGIVPGGVARIALDRRRVASIALDGEPIDTLQLEPPLLRTFLGPSREDRRPVRLAALPEHVTRAVLAAEDDGFYGHAGVSLAGIARAAAVNLRHGEVRQGGSTITQQLVKTLLDTPERSLGRKAREAALAMLLEARYTKRQILEAYLNEVYLGAREGVSLIGIGAAARSYFGADAETLTVGEAATLAGMLGSPGRFSPVANPAAARARRDHVLDRMAALRWITAEELALSRATPVEAVRKGTPGGGASYAVHLAADEAARRFGVDGLERGGWALLSTLDWRDQRAAEEAVARGLAAVPGGKGGRGRPPLEAALVSVDPRDGAILAWVGGRDYGRSQFDRAASAHRQAGSAFKPVVYAAAIALGVVTPASLVADEPLALRLAGTTWSPRDDDGEFLGPITVRAALERSRNLPAVRVALDTGLEPIVDLARVLGVTSRLEAVPALALGAFEVTPVELATVYATFAAGGVRPEVHVLDAVLDGRGTPRPGAPAVAEPVLDAAVAHVITSLLQGVVDRGSGAATRSFGVTGPVAGKTGTSNDGRDAWFCGYSPDRATVVWVGNDDGTAAGLSGARAALPVWARFTAAVGPPGGYAEFVEPAGVTTALIDPTTGALATSSCPSVEREVFLAAYLPRGVCREHGGYLSPPLPQPEGVPVKRPGALRRFFVRLFGRGAPVQV